MSKNKKGQNNFIYQIIEKDLTYGKLQSIRTRFPPEPNGHLHIGHAKSICLNFGIAKKYHGQCNLRFDDTNPVKENIEYTESIKRDIQWLGFNCSNNVHYSSDYFDQLYKYALELINKDLAYVDQLSPCEISKYRGTLNTPGINSPYRNRSIKENLALFSKMRNGNFDEGDACLRAKIDMSSPFIIMRDPVLYRVKFAYHHQTGNKWCIYPTYDFAHCICDALEGITHSLCTLEFQNNRRLYEWILNNISINVHPKQYEFSRLNLEYNVMSKRKLSLLVKNKVVEGWDDPRMPTISGLRRRGYTADSIREFCRRIGVTRQDSNVKMSELEACIRADLNDRAPRAMAVINPVRVIIYTLPPKYEKHITMLNHPNKPEMGTRYVAFNREIFIDRSDFIEQASMQHRRLAINQEVRLRNSYIIKAHKIEKNSLGEIITIFCSHDSETMGKFPSDGRKIEGVIHWVSALHGKAVEFRLYNKLFKEANPAAKEDLLSTINPNSLVISYGFVEESVLVSNTIKPFQFEREGYFCADNRHFSASHPVFNRIVTLRSARTEFAIE